MTDHVVPARGRAGLLRVYLNDHLMAASGALALARRVAASHRGTAAEQELAELLRQCEEDRDALVEIMRKLDVAQVVYKQALAIAAERLGRLKPNGAILHRSPLSTVVELEGLGLAVQARAAAWRTLRELSRSERRIDGMRIEDLITRAEHQSGRLEHLRVRAVAEALGPT
jgi:hypothetical protein